MMPLGPLLVSAIGATSTAAISLSSRVLSRNPSNVRTRSCSSGGSASIQAFTSGSITPGQQQVGVDAAGPQGLEDEPGVLALGDQAEDADQAPVLGEPELGAERGSVAGVRAADLGVAGPLDQPALVHVVAAGEPRCPVQGPGQPS